MPNNFYFIDTDKKFNKLDHIVIPESVTLIGQYQFYKAKAIKYVEIPTTVTKINDYAFYDWNANPMYYAKHFNMLDKNNEWFEVTEIRIPDDVTEIKSFTFINLTTIIKIYILKTVTTIF